MTSSTFTVTLGGETTLAGFSSALRRLEMLLDALAADMADVPSSAWVVRDLRAGYPRIRAGSSGTPATLFL